MLLAGRGLFYFFHLMLSYLRRERVKSIPVIVVVLSESFRYSALKRVEDGVTEFPKCLTYTEDLTEYHKWARSMAKSLGKITVEK